MSSDDERSVGERVRDAFLEKPVLGALVALLLVLAVGFLVAGVSFVV